MVNETKQEKKHVFLQVFPNLTHKRGKVNTVSMKKTTQFGSAGLPSAFSRSLSLFKLDRNCNKQKIVLLPQCLHPHCGNLYSKLLYPYGLDSSFTVWAPNH